MFIMKLQYIFDGTYLFFLSFIGGKLLIKQVFITLSENQMPVGEQKAKKTQSKFFVLYYL